MSLNDTNTTQPSILAITPDDVKFRHIGNTGIANGGVITLATYRDELRGTVRVGVCLVRPGIKYDAEFSRIVAMHRIPGVTYPNGILEMRLADCNVRVQKKRERVRLTESERDALRGLSDRGSAGYYKNKIEYYQLSDFDPRPTDIDDDGEYLYGFVVEDVESDASHNDIDWTICEALVLKAVGLYPNWAAEAITQALELIADNDDNDDDDEDSEDEDDEEYEAARDSDDEDSDEDGADEDEDTTPYADDDYMAMLDMLDARIDHKIELGCTNQGMFFLFSSYNGPDWEGNPDDDEYTPRKTRVTPEFQSTSDLEVWIAKLAAAAKTKPVDTIFGSVSNPDEEPVGGDEDDEEEDM